MYFGTIDVQAAVEFLSGLGLAVDVLMGGINFVRIDVFAERGWGRNSMHPSVVMAERGMSPAAIIDELLVAEIETIRRLAAG